MEKNLCYVENEMQKRKIGNGKHTCHCAAAQYIDELLWGNSLVVFLVGLGLFFTLRLRGMQFRYLAYSLKLAFTRRNQRARGDISQFQALMTALAATVRWKHCGSRDGDWGRGLWGGLLDVGDRLGWDGHQIAEAILAVKYREVDENGQMLGRPMGLAKGLGWKWLGDLCIFCTLSAFVQGECGFNRIPLLQRCRT